MYPTLDQVMHEEIYTCVIVMVWYASTKATVESADIEKHTARLKEL